MPFISEEIFQNVNAEKEQDCIVSTYPAVIEKNENLQQSFKFFKDFVSQIRDIRNKNGLKQRDILPVFFEGDHDKYIALNGFKSLIESIAFVEVKDKNDLIQDQTVTALISTIKIFVQLPEGSGNKSEEREQILEKIKYFEGFVVSLNKKLENQKFVDNAPAEVLEKERKKLADSLANIVSLKSEL